MSKRVPVVYLDSQDYSNFGNVLGGKGSLEHERVFRELSARQANGDAIFAYAMPILSELLQYDARYPETSERKAEAIEQLCKGWALIFPTRLFALEVAWWAAGRGRQDVPDVSALTSDNNWHPSVADAFKGLRSRFLSSLGQMVDDTPHNRAARRRVKSKARKADLSKFVEAAAPEFAAEYRLPAEAIDRSLVALLRQQVTSDEASRLLFSAVAEPTAFVHVYFRKTRENRDLPAFIGGFGRSLQTSLQHMRDKLEDLWNSDQARERWKELIKDWPERLASKSLQWAEVDACEFKIPRDVFEDLRLPGRAMEIPACEKMGRIMHAYVLHTSGAMAHTSKIEHSFGGDLVHSVYVDYVDFWRGDARFVELFRQAFKGAKEKVVPRLFDLPSLIDQFNRKRLGTS